MSDPTGGGHRTTTLPPTPTHMHTQMPAVSPADLNFQPSNPKLGSPGHQPPSLELPKVTAFTLQKTPLSLSSVRKFQGFGVPGWLQLSVCYLPLAPCHALGGPGIKSSSAQLGSLLSSEPPSPSAPFPLACARSCSLSFK